MLQADFGKLQRDSRLRVLMLSHRVPYPPDRGDRIRGFNILKHLARDFDVSLACTSDEAVTEEQREVLGGLTSEMTIQRISGRWGKVRGLGALIGGGAITPACFYRAGLSKVIKGWHRERPFDVVFTYCTGMVHYSREIMGMGNRVRQVIDLVDVDSAKWAEYSQQTRGLLGLVYGCESQRLAKIESGKCDQFDAITVVSDAEAEHYRKHVGDHEGLRVLRHAVDTDYFYAQDDVASKTIVFVGVLNYRPNVEGICWFAREVLPRLQAKVEGVRLRIIGRHVSDQVAALGQMDGIDVVGPVDDVRSHIGDAVVAIAPLLIARGVQTKVLEAMSSARVAVCSPGAANGILAEDGKHLLVADTASQWAEHLKRVIADGGYRNGLRLAARAQVERVYPWEKCLQPLSGIIRGDAAESHEMLTTMRRSA